MAKQNINVGTAANDKKGDSLRAAFQKVNANFTELYEAVGLAATGQDTALTFLGSTLSTDDSSSIVIDRATTVTSDLSVGGDLLPQTANGGDLGSSTLPWRSLYVSNNTIYIGGTAVGVDANGALTTGGTVVGSTPAWANITGKPTFATVATTGAYADLTGKPTIPTLVSQLSNDSGFLTSVSNIQSESDVSIQVNLTDSTTRIWRFGEDGDTVFPNNVSINYSGNNVQFPRIIADSGKAFSVQGQGASGSAAMSWTVDPDAAGQYAAVSVSRAGGDNLAKVVLQAQSNSGDGETVKLWKFDETGALTIPGDIKSNGNINIDINLTDSTLRRWSFGEDGNLTLPQGGNIAEGGGISGAIKLTPAGGANEYQALLIYPTAGEGDHIHLTAGGGTTELYLGDDLHFVKLESDGNIRIQADNGVTGAAWTFGTDGALTIPGDIKSNGNINIDINLTDSTLRRWQFGEDGGLTFPDGYLKIVPNGANPYISNIIDNGFGLVSGSGIQIRQSVADAYGISINSSTTDTSLGGGASLSGGSNIDVNGTRIILANYTANYLDANTGLTGQNKIEINDDEILIGLDVSNITNGTTTSAFNGWTFYGQAGTLTFPDDTVQTTAYNPNSIRSEGDINIEINLSDSTLRRWQFGEDGNLETPGGVQVAGILKIDDGVHEQFQAKADATGVVTHDCSSGHIFRHTSPDANWTANFTNLNLDSTYATSITLIIAQGATGYYPSAVQIGGAAQTINWQGNVNPTVSTSRTDVVTFSIINNSGTYTVLGQLTGF